jgi:hypothetical protein
MNDGEGSLDACYCSLELAVFLAFAAADAAVVDLDTWMEVRR